MKTTHRASATETLIATLRAEGGWKILNSSPGKVIAKASGRTYWFDQTSHGWDRRLLMAH